MPSVLAAAISGEVTTSDSQDEPIWAHTANEATRLKFIVASGFDAKGSSELSELSEPPQP
jgi:hypothetical protein